MLSNHDQLKEFIFSNFFKFVRTGWVRTLNSTVRELWKLKKWKSQNRIFGQKSWTNLKKVGAGEL